jgi:GT2 family glycosyltransferase
MEKKPVVAVVILNWNGKHFLQRFLPAVLDAGDYEVIIADNGSSDDSVSWLQQNYPRVKVILLLRNLGFAKGYNEALKQVTADYYVLLNSDVAVRAGWTAPIIELMESDASIGACQPKILMENNPAMFEYAGAAGGWLDAFGYPFARGRVFDDCEEDQGQYNDTVPVFWASGAAMFVRAAAYHACGGLDEYFFAHMEEIDLCWRLQLAGFAIMVCPQSAVYHVGGGTLPKGNKRKVYLNFRNNLVMLAKNLPLRRLWWILPCRLALDAIAAWKNLLAGDASFFAAVIKAHIAFVEWCIFRRHPSVVPAAKTAPVQGWLNSSIVWAYFVQGKRKFSEIVADKPV